MIYLIQNQPNSAYTTALENISGTTTKIKFSFEFKNDSNNYTYSTHAQIQNSGDTLNRYEFFYFTASQSRFEYLGYYTYTIKHPTTGETLEVGRAKVSSLTSTTVVDDKLIYKETRPVKKVYKS